MAAMSRQEMLAQGAQEGVAKRRVASASRARQERLPRRLERELGAGRTRIGRWHSSVPGRGRGGLTTPSCPDQDRVAPRKPPRGRPSTPCRRACHPPVQKMWRNTNESVAVLPAEHRQPGRDRAGHGGHEPGLLSAHAEGADGADKARRRARLRLRSPSPSITSTSRASSSPTTRCCSTSTSRCRPSASASASSASCCRRPTRSASPKTSPCSTT